MRLIELKDLLLKSFRDKRLGNDIYNLISITVQRVIENPKSGEQKVIYFSRLFEELLSLEDNNGNLDERFEELLLYLNFNSRMYFLYYTESIDRKLSTQDTNIGKLESLAFEYKKINQIQCDPNLCYNPNYPSIRDMISNWIAEEISYLERIRSLAIITENTEKIINKDFKIALDMSVAQFTCLIRGLMERKVILNNNLTELATFISGIVVTKRSENISEGSFRRKYYNIEDSTKNSVIEILNKTIDWLVKSRTSH